MKSFTKKVMQTAVLMSVAGTSAFAADAAATVSFYGLLDVYTASAKPEGGDSSVVTNSGGMTTSFLGASTKIDLGDGLTGLGVVEGFLRPDVGDSGRGDSDTFFARSAFIGLEGDFGKVTMGRNTTLYFISVITTNPFGGSFGFGPSIKHSFLGDLEADSGWSNSIMYATPKMGGFSGSVLYSSGEVAADDSASRSSVNASYGAGKFYMSAAFQTVDLITEDPAADPSDSQDAYMIGASFDLEVAKLFGQYMVMENSTTAGDTDYDTIQVGASVPFGKTKLLISYATTDISAAVDTDRDTAAVGVDHFLSDKVDLYAVAYSDDKSNVDGTASSVNFGGRVRF